MARNPEVKKATLKEMLIGGEVVTYVFLEIDGTGAEVFATQTYHRQRGDCLRDRFVKHARG